MSIRRAVPLIVFLFAILLGCGDDTTGPSEQEWEFPHDITKVISAEPWPNYFAATSGEGLLFVSNTYPDTGYTGSVSVIDMSSDQIVKTIETTEVRPAGITITYANDKVYAVDVGSPYMVEIDAISLALEEVIEVPFSPSDIAAASNGNLYISSYDPPYIYVMDSSDNTIIDYISVGSSSRAMLANHDGSTVYASVYPDQIAVINTATNTVSAYISLDGSYCPRYEMALSDDGMLYCPCTDSDDLVVINTNTNSMVTRVPIGENCDGVAVTPDGKYVLVAACHANAVVVINTDDYSIELIMPTYIGPAGIYITTEGKAYIAGNYADDIYVME